METTCDTSFKVQERLNLLKQWQSAKAWMDAANKVEQLINEWDAFKLPRERKESKVGITFFWNSNSWSDLATAIYQLKGMEPLKEQAKINFEKIGISLDTTQQDIEPEEEKEKYSKKELEAINIEIENLEALLTLEDTINLPNSASSTPKKTTPRTSAHSSDSEEETWAAPKVSNEMTIDHLLALENWAEAKMWDKMIQKIKDEFKGWDDIRLEAQETGLDIDSSYGEIIQGVITAITGEEVAFFLDNYSSLEQEISDRLKEMAELANEKFNAQGANKFDSEQATLEAVALLRKKLSSQVSQSQEKKLPKQEKKIEEEKSQQGWDFMPLFFGLTLIGGTALLIVAKRHAIRKLFSRWLRTA